MCVASLATFTVASLLLAVQSLVVNEEAYQRSDDSAFNNLTVESSLHILRHSPRISPDFLSLLEKSVAHRHRKHREHSRHRLRHRKHVEKSAIHVEQHRDHVEHVEKSTIHVDKHHAHIQQHAKLNSSHGVDPGYAAISKAVRQVSDQISHTQGKWELSNARCCSERTAADKALEQIDEGVATANSQSSAAQGEILKSNKMISQNENRIPDEKDALRSLKEQCDSSKVSFERDLSQTLKDIEENDKMKMQDCTGKSALLQCRTHDGESFLMLDHGIKHASRLSHWRRPAVQRMLNEIAAASPRLEIRPTVFMQFEEHLHTHKCTKEANPECQQVRERYLVMTSDLWDSADEIKEKQAVAEKDCKANFDSIQENIQNAEAQLKQHQTGLAEATADYNEAMEASRLKNEERKRHVKEMTESAQKCDEDMSGLLMEKNAMLKMRMEIIGMAGIKVFIQDCKVGDWVPGECSVPCGKGTRKLTRDILVYPVLDGTKCPALTAEETCNTQRCPVNCEMGEWGGWSACSAKCGGGVIERVRDVKRKAAHGGTPCGDSSETQSCNPQSCDANCKLSGWSPWSKCSKACDGGTKVQHRHVEEAATGQGICPKSDSEKRFRLESCNAKPCLDEKNKGKDLHCESARDVVLLIDGSATLRTAGWGAMKKTAEALINALGKNANLATLLFSGPTDKETLYKCTGKPYKGKQLGAPDLDQDCNLKWLTHFDMDHSGALAKVKAMEWPRGSAITAEALAQAETELDNGRQEAKSVVIVLTAANPLNSRKVTLVANRLRRKARLMWVGVTTTAPTKLSKMGKFWASQPEKENVIYDDFKSISGFKKETINAVIANMCPTLKVV